jgi:V/A-type H+-transporting ATPase subunit G/H
MVKAEILSQIKKAEEDARKTVEDALREKELKIQEAKEQARLILKTAEQESAEYAEKTLASAKESIKTEREKIIAQGLEEAEKLKQEAQKNLDKAVDFLINEFERAVVDA